MIDHFCLPVVDWMQMNSDLYPVTLPAADIAATHRLSERLEKEFFDPEEPVMFVVYTKKLSITLRKQRELDTGKMLTCEVARLHYSPALKCWSLWRSNDCEWKPVPGIKPTEHIEQLLTVVYDNLTSFMYGLPMEPANRETSLQH